MVRISPKWIIGIAGLVLVCCGCFGFYAYDVFVYRESNIRVNSILLPGKGRDEIYVQLAAGGSFKTELERGDHCPWKPAVKGSLERIYLQGSPLRTLSRYVCFDRAGILVDSADANE